MMKVNKDSELIGYWFNYLIARVDYESACRNNPNNVPITAARLNEANARLKEAKEKLESLGQKVDE